MLFISPYPYAPAYDDAFIPADCYELIPSKEVYTVVPRLLKRETTKDPTSATLGQRPGGLGTLGLCFADTTKIY